MVSIEIVNVVATAVLDRPIDLNSLVEIFPQEFSYNPKRYHTAYFRSERMKGVVSVFSSGKMISAGARNIEEAKLNLLFVAKVVGESGFADLKRAPIIQNIVVTADMEKKLDLEGLVETISRKDGIQVMYEPEQFPGAIIHLPLEGNIVATMLLFASGKIVCVGLRKLRDVYMAIDELKTFNKHFYPMHVS